MSGENDVCTLLERILVAPETLIKTFPSWIFSSQKSRLCSEMHFLKAPVWPVCHSILIWSDWEIERLLALLQTFDPFNLELRRPSFPFEQTLSRIHTTESAKQMENLEFTYRSFHLGIESTFLSFQANQECTQKNSWTKKDWTFELCFNRSFQFGIETTLLSLSKTFH